MEVFEGVFNPNNIYQTFFFNIKSVLAYKTIKDLKDSDPNLFNQWELIASSKYNVNKDIKSENAYLMILDDHFKAKGVFYPEFTKIVAITYATVYNENGELKRYFKKIVDNEEFSIIKSFNDVLMQISKDGVESSPQYFPTLCGHNIINGDIPLFLKRLIKYKNEFENKENLIPFILKKYLMSKPWDANIIDTINMWKFSGVSNTPLPVIGDFLKLKRNVDILDVDELSEYYWKNIKTNEKKTLDFLALQSATQTNLVIQLINEMRLL